MGTDQCTFISVFLVKLFFGENTVDELVEATHEDKDKRSILKSDFLLAIFSSTIYETNKFLSRHVLIKPSKGQPVSVILFY